MVLLAPFLPWQAAGSPAAALVAGALPAGALVAGGRAVGDAPLGVHALKTNSAAAPSVPRFLSFIVSWILLLLITHPERGDVFAWWLMTASPRLRQRMG